jgi:hypothetical protein
MIVIVRVHMEMVQIVMRVRMWMGVFVMMATARIAGRMEVIGIRHDRLRVPGASTSATHRLSPLRES